MWNLCRKGKKTFTPGWLIETQVVLRSFPSNNPDFSQPEIKRANEGRRLMIHPTAFAHTQIFACSEFLAKVGFTALTYLSCFKPNGADAKEFRARQECVRSERCSWQGLHCKLLFILRPKYALQAPMRVTTEVKRQNPASGWKCPRVSYWRLIPYME